jgi:ferritin-like metal-binding protein YciE
VSRIEQVFELLDQRPKAKPCAGMKGIIEEGDEHAKEDYDDDDLRDAVIIGSAQRVEHYEIAAYGTAIAHARLLGLDDVVELLESSLEEEKRADVKLTEIAESAVNLEAAADDEEQEVVTRGRRQSASAREMAADRARRSRKQSSSRARTRGRSRR